VKPVILTFIGYYLPGQRAGGPIRTIANLVDRLGDEFEFRVVALDRDLGDRWPYANVQPDTWLQYGRAWVRYSSPGRFRWRDVAEIVRTTPCDVIYLNSFFDPSFTQPVLVNRWLGRFRGIPVVIAPRGEFSEGALRIKRFKKAAYIRVATALDLYGGLLWQASSTFEARDIAQRLLVGPGRRVSGRITVAGNIVIAPDLVSTGRAIKLAHAVNVERANGGPVRVCFLARISPMKNLDYALGVLSQVRVPVQFSIYGPVEDSRYWERCQRLMAALPAHVEVAYKGPIDHGEVVPTLARHDLFLFPTRGENFGHVIHEALEAGLPLLISDRTPWQHLAEKGVGWELPLDDRSAFVRRIDEVAGWRPADFERAAANARTLCTSIADDEANVEANRRLFLDAIERAAPTR
jgi:glycosyltransferase involved in cell wall biosynthesis